MLANSVNLTIITNPFEPAKNPIKDFLPVIEGQTLAGYLGDLKGEYIVSLNGELVEEEDYKSIFLRQDDHIIVSPIPFGGDGGGKGILRFVAVVALSYFTMGAGSVFAGAGLSSGMQFAASSAAFIGGVAIINEILPPAVPTNAGSNDLKDSPTYGLDGAKNTSQEGLPVPLVYGNYRVAGNVISTFTENINETQYLYTLVNAGEGEIAGIESILINDQPVENFSEVNYQVRDGSADQKIIGWFGEIVKPYSMGSKVSKEWTTYTTRDEIDKVRLDFVFPSGLSGINEENGDRYEVEVSFEMQYRAYDPNNKPEENWNLLPWIDDRGNTTYSSFRVKGKTGSTLRRSVKSDLLFEQMTEVRVRRTTEESTSDYIHDTVSISDVNEILVEKVRYQHTALLGIRIKLTDQLNNQPKITFLHKGIKIKVWDGKKWVRKSSNNPAWIVYDVLSNARYGGGIKDDFIQLRKFKEWAAWCEDQELTFDGVLDADSNLFDSLEPVFRAGHAKMVSVGTKISVSVEKPDVPVMMFSNANIIRDSFSIDWLSVNDRANEIEVTYFDKKFRNQQRTVKVYDEDSLARGELQRPMAMTLIGCVEEEKAFYEGLLAMNVNKYIQQTVAFDAHVDAIACTIGSVIYVQHDMPQWGYSGRIRAGSTRSEILLDYDISEAMSGETPTNILLHKSAQKRGEAPIIRVSGNTFRIRMNAAGLNITRVVISGRDYDVVGIRKTSATESEVTVDHVFDPIYSGEVCELWETEIFEERLIAGVNGESVTVTEEFGFDPDPYAQFMTGKINKMKKRFRIMGIDFNTDHVRTIRAIEYNESIYDKDIPFTPGGDESDLGILKETELSEINETLVRIGKNLRPKVTINYVNQSNRYQTTRVYVASNGGEFESINSNRSQVSFESEDNAQLRIRLVPVDSSGLSMGINNVTEHKYLVLGKTAPPADVVNFAIDKEVGGIKLTWDSNPELDIDGYEIRQGSSWDKGEIIAENLGSTILFVPIKEPGEYVYQIRAIDTSGNLSLHPAKVAIGLIRPERVKNFTSVQHIDKILFQWDRPDDRTVNNFWLREGDNWSNSVLVGSISGTSFELPATVPGVRTFWIKAVDLVGLDSEESVFSTTEVANLEDRNMVYEVYHGKQPDGSFKADGIKLNCEGANPIQMIDDVAYAEYTARLTIPKGLGKIRARNAVGLKVGVLVKNELEWKDARFPWVSEPAKMPWAGSGDPEMVSFKSYISMKTKTDDVFPGTKYLFPLNEDLKGILTHTEPLPESDTDVTYSPARYDKGVLVDPTTYVKWPITQDEEWSVAFWALFPKALFERSHGGVCGFLETEGDNTVQFIFSPRDRRFIAREAGELDLIIENFYPNQGDFALVCISQVGTTRVLRVRLAGSGVTKKCVREMRAPGKLRNIGLGLHLHKQS
ncbi:conserved hypothetical protein [Vibrio coralliirubri]|uniref:host specificity factor TipJ family phage tail protein n=1 Tax=Vibrio coralliirubri TaxID=1516159 RepID=UPI000633F606|nr:host specificity factor TipJ family phage tail protein [Vibrio coralliirubri]CDT54282.1 conserved hypothetical protein [Vibrio coralliirubri]